MFSVKYAKLTFWSDNFKSVEAEVSYELDGADFDIEELNIEGTVYNMKRQSYTRRKIVCDYISRMFVDVWEKIMEHEHYINDCNQESYELRDL